MKEVRESDVVDIREYFKDLNDPRSSINRKHFLGDLIVICILAVLAGADGPKAIGIWADSQQEWLRRHLPLPGGVPSHDTIGRLLAALKPSAFQAFFEKWISSLRENPRDGEGGADDPEIVAIDGKALRRSHDRRRNLGALHLVSAWSVQRGISLGQLATSEKSNEITAIPKLIDQIDIKDAIVTIDAAGCQKEIAKKIIDAEGDYVLALKGNHEKLHEAVMNYFLEQIDDDSADVAVRTFQEEVKGHGRADSLTNYQLAAPATLPERDDWKGLRTIGVTIRISESIGKTMTDVRHYINSLKLGVQQFAGVVRGHSGVENTLRWCLDVTFRGDENRTRNRHADDNLAWQNALPSEFSSSNRTRKALRWGAEWQGGISTTWRKPLGFQRFSMHLPSVYYRIGRFA